MCALWVIHCVMGCGRVWFVVVGRNLEEFLVEVGDVARVEVYWCRRVGRMRVGCMSNSVVFYVCLLWFVVLEVRW